MAKPLIFMAFANPNDPAAALPALNEEESRLKTVLDDYQLKKEWGFYRTVRAITPTTLHQSLASFDQPIRIFHFGGHADPKSLALIDKQGNSLSLHVKNLPKILAPLVKKGLKLVFLNGCATLGHVKALHEVGVPAVIATEKKVLDIDSCTFAQTFYEYLVKGYNLVEAFNQSKVHAAPSDGGSMLYMDVDTTSTEFAWGLYLKPGPAKKQTEIKNWTITPEQETAANLMARITHSNARIKSLLLYSLESKVTYQKYETWFKNWAHNKDGEIDLEAYPYHELILLSEVKQQKIIAQTDSIIFLLGNDYKLFWESLKTPIWFYQALLKMGKYGIVCEGDVDKIESYFTDDITLSNFEMISSASLAQFSLLGNESRMFNKKMDTYFKRIETKKQGIKRAFKEELFRLNYNSQMTPFRFHQDPGPSAFTQATYNLILIEGTKDCAQELLCQKILRSSKLKIDSNALKYTISITKNLTEGLTEVALLSEIGRCMGIEQEILSNLPQKEEIRSWLINSAKTNIQTHIHNQLEQNDVVLIFNDVQQQQAHFLHQLGQFWSLITKGNRIPAKHLIIFAIHKGVGKAKVERKNHWNTEGFESPKQINQSGKPLMHIQRLEVIHPLDNATLQNWQIESRHSFQYYEPLQQLLTEHTVDHLLTDPFMMPVLAKMVEMAQCPEVISELTKI